jgi:hypothetical protein
MRFQWNICSPKTACRVPRKGEPVGEMYRAIHLPFGFLSVRSFRQSTSAIHPELIERMYPELPKIELSPAKRGRAGSRGEMRSHARRLNRLWIKAHKQARSHSPIGHRITY